MDFKVGDRVVCIYSFNWESAIDKEEVKGPTKNEILLIDFIDSVGLGFNMYNTEEGYSSYCFRKLELDYNFAERVMKKVSPKVAVV